MVVPSAQLAKCWGVIPAAGIGSRMRSETPKQYLEVAGATLLEHSLAALLLCDFIETVVVALHPDDETAVKLPGLKDSRVLLTEGGAQRSDSVFAGLLALDDLASPDDWVLVHDAARPCVSPEDISALACAVIDSGVGGILAQPIVDTVKRSDAHNQVDETLPREHLWRAQTPQMFRLHALREALENAKLHGLSITDEASAMELAGQGVQLVSSCPGNLKVTVPEDLPLAEFYLAQQYAKSNS
jgi:2-C-methyl-D-erythritol 4-phosphate cytidylyltransferase